jgi:uncharacterized membrane protein affecting hemolysin expression
MREIAVHNFPVYQQDAVLDWPAFINAPDNVLAAGNYTLDLRTVLGSQGVMPCHYTTQKRVEPICANMIW